MTTNPFQTAQGPNSLPFAVATTPPSVYPKMSQLAGVLVLITPTRYEQNVPSGRFRNQDGSPTLQDRMTCDVECVDVIPAGFDTPTFPGMYFSQERIITQLQGQLGTGRPLLGRISLFKPNEAPGPGNPWGLDEPTPQDVERAKQWYQGVRPVPSPSQAQNPVQASQQQFQQGVQAWNQQHAGQYAAPQQPAPQQYAPQNGAPAWTQSQPYQQPQATNGQQAPQQAPAAQGGYAQQFAPQPQPGQAPPANPWAQNGQPLPAPAPGVNPFAPQQ